MDRRRWRRPRRRPRSRPARSGPAGPSPSSRPHPAMPGLPPRVDRHPRRSRSDRVYPLGFVRCCEGSAAMQFGFTLKPEHTVERTIALARQAEGAGFEYGWMFDSPRPLARPVPAADAHRPGDTNAAAGHLRDEPGDARAIGDRIALAVLDEISGGRMDLGIGRGDSARRVLGKPPTTMATLEEAIIVIKASSRVGRSSTKGRSCDCRGPASGPSRSGSPAMARWPWR